MSQAARDQNNVTTIIAVSSVDGVTPVVVYANPLTHRLLVDSAGGGGTGTVTSVSVVSANGFAGTVATATTTPAITISTTVTGLLKGNGTSVSAAAAGTDYAPTTSGTSILKGNGSGGFSNAAAGTDYEVPLTFSTGLTRSTNTITVNTSQNIATLSNLTSNGLVTTSGSNGTLSVTVPGTGVLTALAVNVGSAGAFVTFNGALGTPSSGTLTSATGLPISTGVSGLGTGIATFLATPSSANLKAAVTDETGSGVLVFATSPDFTTPTISGIAIPSISSTNTLTNKRITKRVGTTTSSGTPTINTDNFDYYSLTAQAVTITSFTTNLSGTPTDAQTLWISITDNGTARGITWGASFEASTVALPTTTVISTRLDVGFVWNAVTSKWRCVATC